MRFCSPLVCFLLVINYLGSAVIFSSNENMIYFFDKNKIDNVVSYLVQRTSKSAYEKQLILFTSFVDEYSGKNNSEFILLPLTKVNVPELPELDGSKLLSWLNQQQNYDDQLLYEFTLKKNIIELDILESIRQKHSILLIKNGEIMNIIGYDSNSKEVMVLDSSFQQKIVLIKDLNGDNFYIIRSPTTINNAYFNKSGFWDCTML